jgi:flagellin
MRLNHNLASLNIYREHEKVLKGQSAASARISSGYKINYSGDGPNALAQSEKLRIQIRGLQMAQRNVQDGVSMLQTAEGGLDSVTSSLHRLKELAIQAGGTTNDADKAVIQGEIDQVIQGIDNVVNFTEFNGIKLLDDNDVDGISFDNKEKLKCLNMASGANVDEKIQIPVYNLSSDKLGIDTGVAATSKYLKDIKIKDSAGIDESISVIDAALSTVLSVRSRYGAIENRFESTYKITDAVGMNIQNAESSLRDADLAEEMMNYSKNSILMEAGTAMMVQANKFPQDILRILENVK